MESGEYGNEVAMTLNSPINLIVARVDLQEDNTLLDSATYLAMEGKIIRKKAWVWDNYEKGVSHTFIVEESFLFQSVMLKSDASMVQ